jgi:hypothetical protein
MPRGEIEMGHYLSEMESDYEYQKRQGFNNAVCGNCGTLRYQHREVDGVFVCPTATFIPEKVTP